MNWKNPETYDEKIHWLIVNYYDENYGIYADKYEMRKYVTECGLEKNLVPLLGVFDDAESIEFDKLPDKFILKTTQGSGEDFYVICTDKKQINIIQTKKKLKKALKNKFYKYNNEYHYKKIKPKIICETLLDPECGSRITDYKVVCSWGSPIAILVCSERNQGRDYYSKDWEYLPYVKEEYRSGMIEKKPLCLEKLLEAASILSQPFPLCRIDFYILEESFFVGEITLTPSAGHNYYLLNEGNKELGKKIKLFQNE